MNQKSSSCEESLEKIFNRFVRDNIIKIRMKSKQIYDKLTEPKIIKISVYISLLSFLPGLIIGIAIAANFGPFGYSLLYNYISDLGSKKYTPAPFILDITVIISAVFILPLILNLGRLYTSAPTDNIDNSKRMHYINHFRRIFGYIGLVSLIVGVIGLFNVGIFSLDRSPWNLHLIFASLTFVGFAFGSFFTGLAIIMKKKIIPRTIGFFMVLGPPISGILFLIGPQPLTRQLLEWVMTFMALAWYYPLTFITLQKTNTLLFFKSGY